MMLSLRRLSSVALLSGCTLLACCAAPPLRLYTLSMPSDQDVTQSHLSAPTSTIEISRAVLPDYLDSQDIVLRNGDEIVRSPKSRWATRLSLSVTDLITSQIAHSHPNVLITDQPLADAATLRVQINISRLVVNANGSAVLDANWAILPLDPNRPLIRDRVHLSETGDVSTDAAIAALMRKMIIELATHINQSVPPHA